MKSKITLFALVLIWALTWSVRAAEPIIRDVVVRGEDPQHTAQIKRIIPLREGRPLDITDIARTFSILKKTGLYKSIKIEEEKTPGGIRIVIHLEARRFVRRIRFKGAFPLFESELRKAISIREGAPYSKDKVAADVQRLEVFLQKEGFFESEVRSEIKVDRNTGDVIITFRLKKGFSYTVKKVLAYGNSFLSAKRIRFIIRRKMPFRYRRQKLDEGLDSVLKRYRRMGFYEATIKLDAVELDPKSRAVTVKLRISEGRRAKVIVRGNWNITDRRIKKELAFVDEGSIDEYAIEESAHKIERLYKSRGYRSAGVGWQVREKEDGKGRPYFEIVFQVKEGPKVRVKKVEFRGATAFKAKKLHKQMITGRRREFGRASLLVDDVLSDDIAAIEAFYRKWGYEEVRVETPEIEILNSKGSRAKVVIPIHEGPQTVVREVRLEGVEFFENKMIFDNLTLVKGTPFDPTLLPSDKRKLILLYADWGFPYAKVSQTVMRLEGGENVKGVAIVYKVREGRRVTVGETVVRGNYRTRGRVLTREVELAAGEPFSYSALLASRRNLRTLAFLYSARLDTLGLEENMDVVNLLLAVRERPVRTVDFGVGYDSDLGPNLRLELADLNLLGLGKAGRLKLMGGGDINRVEALYTDPRFMGTHILAETKFSWSYERHKAYDLTQIEGRFSLQKKLTTHITGTLATRTSWNSLRNVDIEQIEDVTIQENTIMGTGPMIIYDTRDDFIDPSTGWFSRLSAEYVDEFTHGDEFVKLEAQGSRFIPVTPRLIFAATLNIGHIEPLDASSVPLQEVYFAGGNRSVRGYSEDGLGPRTRAGNPRGGLDKVVTSVELRFPVWRFVHGVVFCDSGQLADRFNRLKLADQEFTVGTGIRLMTPVGPVRLDWGYKLEPVSWEKRYRWHFSFGYPF